MFDFRSSIILIALMLAVLFGDVCSSDVVEVVDDNNGLRVGTIYKISVTPAQEPVPAFKYRLTIEPHKTIPGNAITHYLRSLGENSLDHPWKSAREQFGMDVHDWYHLETKVEDIPLDKLKIAAGLFDSYVEGHLRRATLCRDCDWGLAVEDLRGTETIYFLLPSVQQTRSMARALLLRNRLAVIEGRYDDSIDHMRMTYQLGQNVNELGFLVANLIGIAEVGMANQGMLDLMAAKDSPNMYWALAELPQPIISIRHAMRLESSFGLRYFPYLMDVETADHSKEKWGEHLSNTIQSLTDVDKMMHGSTSEPENSLLQSKLLAAAVGLSGYSAAKKRLLESGLDPVRVEKMAVAQVLLIDAAREYQFLANEVEKTYYVPFVEFGKFEKKMGGTLRNQVPTRLGAMIANTFLPAVAQVRRAEVRVQAQLNVLMAIESIRNHIAITGDFPNSLDELALPVRNSPFTSQPINYEFKGETAVLRLPKDEGNQYSYIYEMSIAPKE